MWKIRVSDRFEEVLASCGYDSGPRLEPESEEVWKRGM
jgi:hypothetical protein